MEGKDFPLFAMQGPSIDSSSFRPPSISQGHVPLQESVSSASEVPSQQPTPSIEPQIASLRYMEQFKALMERQRQVFDEERALWQTESADLNSRIVQLEVHVRRLTSQTSTPGEVASSERDGSFWSGRGNDGSRHTSSSSTGNEVWHPHQSTKPTRVFSNRSSPGSSSPKGRRLPSVAENLNTGKKSPSSEIDGLTMTPIQPLHYKASISGHLIHKDLEGIHFKASGLPPSLVQAVMTPQSDSESGSGSPSARSPISPSQVSPNTAVTPPRAIPLPQHLDPYLKDAGHTPLARHTQALTSLDGSGENSGGSTPTQPEIERPPLEPTATREQGPKMPTENKDSYFPPPPEASAGEPEQNTGLESIDEDPALEGPLGLTNDPENERNKGFMKELDKKLSSVNLREAAAADDSTSSTLSPPSTSQLSSMLRPTGQQEGKQTEKQSGDDQSFEQPEAEPKLRLKSSMNFGTAFGASSCGKNFGMTQWE